MDEYIGFAIRYCCRYRNPEEYVSAALYGIAYAMFTLTEKKDRDKWIKSCMVRFIRSHNEHLIKVPRSTRHRHAKKGVPLVLPKILSLSQIVSHPEYSENQELELLEFLAENPDDIQILQLRLEGYKDPEIAETIGKSVSHIQRRRVAMEEKYNANVSTLSKLFPRSKKASTKRK